MIWVSQKIHFIRFWWKFVKKTISNKAVNFVHFYHMVCEAMLNDYEDSQILQRRQTEQKIHSKMNTLFIVGCLNYSFEQNYGHK